jgi:hypothetical protein
MGAVPRLLPLRVVARPRTLGPPITFRLPLNLHQVAVERAEANGETIDQYVKRHFVAALERHRDRYGQITEGTGVTIRTDPIKVNPRWKNPKARP